MKLMYVYVQTLIMLLRLGMHTKYINKNKNKNVSLMTKFDFYPYDTVCNQVIIGLITNINIFTK